jgi:hypothetical protein
MTSVGWLFDFVSNWSLKSFRIKEPPVLSFFKAKTIKEPHGSFKIWQKTNDFMGSYLMSSSVLGTVVIYENWVFDFWEQWLWTWYPTRVLLQFLTPAQHCCGQHPLCANYKHHLFNIYRLEIEYNMLVHVKHRCIVSVHFPNSMHCSVATSGTIELSIQLHD